MWLRISHVVLLLILWVFLILPAWSLKLSVIRLRSNEESSISKSPRYPVGTSTGAVQGTRLSSARGSKARTHSKATGLPLVNKNDLLYATTITLGGLEVTVQLDTGSADLWVYIPNKKLRITNTTNLVVNSMYAIGSVAGPVEFAKLEFAEYTVPSQAFINAQAVSNLKPQTSDGISGVMGLGFDVSSSSPINSKILKAFGKNSTLGRPPIANIFYKDIKRPNFFTFLLGRSTDIGNETEGIFTIGEYLPQYRLVEDAIKLESQIPQHWSVFLDGLSVEGEPFTLKSKLTKVPKGKALAVLDTGYSKSLLPRKMVDFIYGSIPGAVKVGEVPLLAKNYSTEWVVPCDISARVELTIGGEIFLVHPLDLASVKVIPLADGRNATFCSNMYSYMDDTTDDFDLILGDSFLKNAYTSFDYGTFDGLGRLTEKPYIQIVTTTNNTEAQAEFNVVRKRQLLLRPPELAPSVLREAILGQDLASKGYTGVLRVSPEIRRQVHVYLRAVVGMLAPMVALSAAMCVTGFILLLRRYTGIPRRSM